MECVMIGLLFHLLGLHFFICKIGIMILLTLYPRIVMDRQHITLGSFINNEEIYFLHIFMSLCGNWQLLLCACMLSHFSCVRLFPTLWTVGCQTPLSMGFSWQEYWSGLSCPLPGDLPGPGISPSLQLLHWQVGSLSLVPPGKLLIWMKERILTPFYLPSWVF